MRVLLPAIPFLCLFIASCQPADEPSTTTVTTASQSSESSLDETPEQRERRLRATFPAQQREPGDPEVIARGEAVYSINCRSCHGQDLRGGDIGGPNLLRSPVVLSDQNGELIKPVVQNGRENPGMPVMPPLALADSDIEAVAEYIHSVVATSQGQGAPPPVDIELDIIVGNADAGKTYFDDSCSACHSVTGDLVGYATKVSNNEWLQNSWVAGRRWRGEPEPGSTERRAVRATVTLDNGDVVSGVLNRRDDFLVSLTTEEGDYRSFTLFENTTPAVMNVTLDDPLQRHRELLSLLSDDDMHDVTAYLVTLK